jgi:ABC-2 type transport system ATP-binding protein
MPEKMIEIQTLSKRYGNFSAVDSISLDVYGGEIFAFLGVNGAGKTTTIRMLTGVLQPTSGRIRIGGFDLAEHPLQAKSITGYIPDRPYLYAKLTGREFLYFVADLYQLPIKATELRIDQLLSEFGLTSWEDELIESYSHGMKQRLATCGGLLHQPRLLVVDEPMVGLDPHGAKFLKESFKRYAAQGMTIFLSTHSLNVAEEVANRLAIIQQGRIIAVGTLAEIRAQSGHSQAGLESLFLQLTAEMPGEEASGGKLQ